MGSTRYHDEYRQKRISAQDAAGLVQSGMSIHLGGAANIATIIDKYT